MEKSIERAESKQVDSRVVSMSEINVCDGRVTEFDWYAFGTILRMRRHDLELISKVVCHDWNVMSGGSHGMIVKEIDKDLSIETRIAHEIAQNVTSDYMNSLKIKIAGSQKRNESSGNFGMNSRKNFLQWASTCQFRASFLLPCGFCSHRSLLSMFSMLV